MLWVPLLGATGHIASVVSAARHLQLPVLHAKGGLRVGCLTSASLGWFWGPSVSKKPPHRCKKPWFVMVCLTMSNIQKKNAVKDMILPDHLMAIDGIQPIFRHSHRWPGVGDHVGVSGFSSCWGVAHFQAHVMSLRKSNYTELIHPGCYLWKFIFETPSFPPAAPQLKRRAGFLETIQQTLADCWILTPTLMGPYLLYRHINVEHSLLIDHVQGVLYDLSLYKLCSPMCSPNLHVNVQLGNRGPSYDRNIYGHLSKVRRRMWSSISNDW